MTSNKNLFYPSGALLCTYEKDKITYFFYHAGALIKEISYLDEKGNPNGKEAIYQDETILYTKEYLAGSNTRGTIQFYNKDKQVNSELTEYFEKTDTSSEEIYSDPVHKTLIGFYYHCDRYKGIQHHSMQDKPFSTYLFHKPNQSVPHGKIRRFKKSGQAVENIYKKGVLKQQNIWNNINNNPEIFYTVNWQDPSTGEGTSFQPNKKQSHTIIYFKNNITFKQEHYKSNLLVSTDFLDTNGRTSHTETQAYNSYSDKDSITKYMGKAWDEKGFIIKGQALQYNTNNQIIMVSDFYEQNGFYIKNGLEISRASNFISENRVPALKDMGYIRLLNDNGKMLSECHCHIGIDPETQILTGYSNLSDKTKALKHD